MFIKNLLNKNIVININHYINSNLNIIDRLRIINI